MFKFWYKSFIGNVLLIASCVMLLTLVIPLLFMNKYNHPASFDDFSNLYAFSTASTESLFSPLKLGNRYSTFLTLIFYHLLKISPTFESMQSFIFFYRLYSVFIILFFFISLFILFSIFNKYFFKITKTTLLFVYSLFMFSIVNFIGRFAFLFYDIVSTAGYVVGLCLSVILISCIPSYCNKNTRKIPILILTVIICGTVEYYTILVAYIAFIVICIKYCKQKKIDWFMCCIILYSFIIALSYGLAPWVHDKAVLYSGISGAGEKIYTLKNFVIFVKSIIKYFIYAIKDYISLKFCIYNLILIFLTAIFLYKRQIKIPILFYISFLTFIFLMSITLFFSGVFNVDRKDTSVMIFRFFTFIVFTLFFAQCVLFFLTMVGKICVKYNIIYEINSIREKLSTNVLFNKNGYIIFSCFFLLFFITNIVFAPLPIRSIISELYNGSAKTYDTQVWKIYKDLLDSKEEEVIIYEPDIFIQTSFIQGIWTEFIYENHNEWLIPEEKFFNKKIIIKKRLQDL